jgi:phage major head subunit gpT-like protein
MRFSRASSSAATTTPTTTVRVSADASKKDTTIEYQRVKAKEMVKYFKEQQYQQLVEDSTVFGFTKKNEINNGRWTMFGLLVGMMTEYATGVDFIDQIKLLVNVLGIADLD